MNNPSNLAYRLEFTRIFFQSLAAGMTTNESREMAYLELND